MPAGLNDIAVSALDAFGNVLAVKIVRAQMVPGSINGGVPIVLTTGDDVIPQNVTVNNVPPGSNTALVMNYRTVNGTVIPLQVQSTATYGAVSPGNTFGGDMYEFQAIGQRVNAAVGTTNFTPVGSSVSLNLPAPWIYAGPVPSQYPSFSYAYSGLSGSAMLSYYAQVSWQSVSLATNSIGVFATPAYLGTLTTVTIPNLSAVPGFVPVAPSGTLITWLAQIYGGSFPAYTFPPPSTAAISFAQQNGVYTQP
jgi:hypothetical protein